MQQEHLMQESEAIALLRRGDIGGLEKLVEMYYVEAVRTAYLVTRDRPLAEDIAQAAFLRVYERIHQFQAERPFAPWFFRSVVNDALMTERWKRHATIDSKSGAEEAMLATREPAPDDLLVAAETSEAIWDALGKLTAEQRAVIVMRYYVGLSEAEMSSRLDLPRGTVKSRLHTARQRLRHLLPAWVRPATNGD
jgi:RNA polymerase sigma-70 factor (ECF subfamily)